MLRAVIKRCKSNGRSELHVNVELAPLGSFVFGAALLWVGVKTIKRIRKRWWLPMAAGLAMTALHRWSQNTIGHQEEE
jgi:hypothetical protein